MDEFLESALIDNGDISAIRDAIDRGGKIDYWKPELVSRIEPHYDFMARRNEWRRRVLIFLFASKDKLGRDASRIIGHALWSMRGLEFFVPLAKKRIVHTLLEKKGICRLAKK
jgi:hypothetical protein